MSLAMRAINGVLRKTVKPILMYTPFHEQTLFIPRDAINFMAHWAIPIRANISKCKIADNIKAEWVNLYTKHKSSNVILYLHGGGYLACSSATHRNITSRLSTYSDCPVLVPNYSLAPEHVYPKALTEAFDCYVYLLKMGYYPENISVAGDSAGGNLTLALIDMLIDEGVPVPASIACISPWCDLSSSMPSIQSNRHIDPMLPYNRIREAALLYAGDMELSSPKLSPIFKDNFEGYPPVIFHTGEYEILRDEMRATFHKIALTSKNETVYKEWKGAPHVFQLFAGVVPESTTSLMEMSQFIAKHFNHA
jgi:acetyl esterase/lipase